MGRHSRHTTRKSKDATANTSGTVDRIYGVHAVEAALANPRRKILSMHASENGFKRLEAAIAARGLAVHLKKPKDIAKLTGTEARHQGVMIEALPLETLNISELETAKLVVVLDSVSDPHNVGAVLRSAAAFGADALVMTARNSPPLDGALAKAASGGLEHVGIARVPNLARALRQMGDCGFTRIGFDGSAETNLKDAGLSSPLALVFGAEGKGLRRLTAKTCDRLCRLTATGPLSSLNVSNAAAIALYIVSVKAT